MNSEDEDGQPILAPLPSQEDRAEQEDAGDAEQPTMLPSSTSVEGARVAWAEVFDGVPSGLTRIDYLYTPQA